MDAEYSTLRDEIMKWQDRRIIFSQIAITLVLGYTVYMIGKDISVAADFSWQIVSIIPLLFLTLGMHITKMFEQFMIRAAAYIAVYYDSEWEKHNSKLSFSKNSEFIKRNGKSSFSKGWVKMGYNRSMATVNCLIASTSVFILYKKFSSPPTISQIILFCICALIFAYVFIQLFFFNTMEKKETMVKQWEKIKSEFPPTSTNNIS